MVYGSPGVDGAKPAEMKANNGFPPPQTARDSEQSPSFNGLRVHTPVSSRIFPPESRFVGTKPEVPAQVSSVQDKSLHPHPSILPWFLSNSVCQNEKCPGSYHLKQKVKLYALHLLQKYTLPHSLPDLTLKSFLELAKQMGEA